MAAILQKYAQILAILGVGVQSLLILISWRSLPPQLPIFYSRAWGGELLAPTAAIWVLPIICLAVFLLNFYLANRLNFSESRQDLSNKRGLLSHRFGLRLESSQMSMKSSYGGFLGRILFIFSLIIAMATLYDTIRIISLLA